MALCEIWLKEDGSAMWTGHSSERRRHLDSPADRLIAVIDVAPNEPVSERVNEAVVRFERHQKVIRHASELLSDSYSIGLVAGDRIQLLCDRTFQDRIVPNGTILEVDLGDLEFPDVVYANTTKWPKGRGYSDHWKLVMLSAADFGLTYRRLARS